MAAKGLFQRFVVRSDTGLKAPWSELPIPMKLKPSVVTGFEFSGRGF